MTTVSFILFVALAHYIVSAHAFEQNDDDLPAAIGMANSPQAPLAAGLYVFGDSYLDAGNNNYLSTGARANYTPYGIDFPKGVTGRFTNGFTMADFLATWLGLSLPPAYLDPLSLSTKNLQGFNYASASAGILPETGIAVGENLSLGKQVGYFRKTVEEYLPLYYKNATELSKHLGTSIFLICMGTNDYVNNYFQRDAKKKYNRSLHYTPDQFSDLLVEQLGQHLKDIYMLGARKLVVWNILPLPNNSTVGFNMKLKVKMDEVRYKLDGSNFVIFDNENFSQDLIANYMGYGLTDIQNPCCVVPPPPQIGKCIPKQPPCPNRNSHLRWDMAHLTETAYKIAAKRCFSGTDLCTPLNILQLAKKP